ncbi:MAG: hypothetical protein AAF698_06515 [Pseudomonadota bacterium]
MPPSGIRFRLSALCRFAAAGLVMAAFLSPGAGTADPVDLLFKTEHMEGLPPGAALSYAHNRTALPALQLGPDFEQRIALETVQEGDGAPASVKVTMDADGAPRQLEQFRGVPGNPILMVFLETTVSAISRATGGSPFYLRNRMREALRDRLSSMPMILQVGTARLPARVLEVAPFVEDENATRLGAFAGLSLRFVVAEQAPGMILSMRASTPEEQDGAAAYSEEIALVPNG